MLILLYSDANYVLEGFTAEFSITQCPKNCSDHGTCIENQCSCNPKWEGEDCSLNLCPNDCNYRLHKGVCKNEKCFCFEGFSGQACDLHSFRNTGNR